MGFKENHTTKELKIKDPVLEAGKLEISNDMYALGQLLETLINRRGV